MPYAVAAFDFGLYTIIQEAGKTIAGATEAAGKSVTAAIKAQTSMQEKKWEDTNDHLSVVAKRMCAWAAPEYNEIGEGWDRKAMLIAQAAIYTSIIALNTYVQNQNYKIQYIRRL